MPLYKFGKNDIITNTIKTHPKQEFFVYSGSIYYQNQNAISGANTSNTYGIPTGYINLFNENVDRKTRNTGRTIGTSSVPDTGMIYPFLIKDSSGFSFKTTTKEQYETLDYGAIMSSSYTLSSSIGRYFQASTQYDFFTTYYNNLPEVISDYIVPNNNLTWDEQAKREFIETYVSKSSPLINLENVLKEYSIFSPHFLLSSSYGDKRYQDVTILEIPQLFYGSKVKKGTVELNYYYTGSLVGRLVDNTQNGELIQVSGTITANNGKVAGVVLYNHGMILLTGSWDLVTGVNNFILSSSQAGSSLTSSYNIHKWNHWGATMPVSSNNRFYERTLFESDNQYVKTAITYNSTSYTIVNDQQYINTTVLSQSLLDSASYSLSFLGTHRVPTMTMFANAPKGELNWSNNPTFLEYSTTKYKPLTGSYYFNEQTKTIKNIVSSSIDNYSASFEKVTYINQVNIYDDMGNLIGVAKTSKPIKKTEDTDFTFKLKLDM